MTLHESSLRIILRDNFKGGFFMREKMLVTQALDERDLLVKKISDKIDKASFVDTIKPNEDRIQAAGVEWRKKVWVEEAYPNILFAKDGEIYDIAGMKTIVIGGAYSVDKFYRLSKGYNWFEDEQPSDEIKAYVEKQLSNNDWNVDVVLSHTVPYDYRPVDLFLSMIDQSTVDESTELWLGEIEKKLDYKWWYAGHYHTSRVRDKVQIMFEDIEEFLHRKLDYQ